MPLVSVIVPVYNTSPYLRRCLDSLLSQTLKDIEIICVNDGSTDESPQILDEYAKRDGRVRVIHQENSGVSAARNAALALVQSPYVGFVDSDDWVDAETYQAAAEYMQQDDVDLVCWGNCTWIDQNGLLHKSKKISPRQTRFSTVSFSREHVLNDQVKRDIINVVWNKLYHMGLIRQHLVVFPAAFHQFEDFVFNASYLAWCKKAYFINCCFYHHRSERQGSIMTDFSRGRKPPVYFTVMSVFESVYDYYSRNGKVDDNRFFLSEMLAGLLGLGLWFSAGKDAFYAEAREFVKKYALPDTGWHTFRDLKEGKAVVRFFPVSFVENIFSVINIGDKKVFRILWTDVAFDRRHFKRKRQL